MICDRHPSAKAKVVVYTRSGLLYLCGHCSNRHFPALMAAGYRVASVDESRADAGQRMGWLGL